MKVKLVGENYNQDYVRNLLRARGIKDIDRFLNPDESCLQSWEDLDNIKNGVNLIANLAPEARVGLVVD